MDRSATASATASGTASVTATASATATATATHSSVKEAALRAAPLCGFFMDERVAVAEAVAVAVTEAVAEADQSIHDQSIHDPSIHPRSTHKKLFPESKKPCSPPFQIKNDLRRLNMKNRFFKKSSPNRVYTNVLGTI